MELTINRTAAKMMLAGRTPKIITPAEFAEQQHMSYESAVSYFKDPNFPSHKVGKNLAAVDILVDIWLIENPKGRRIATRNAMR